MAYTPTPNSSTRPSPAANALPVMSYKRHIIDGKPLRRKASMCTRDETTPPERCGAALTATINDAICTIAGPTSDRVATTSLVADVTVAVAPLAVVNVARAMRWTKKLLSDSSVWDWERPTSSVTKSATSVKLVSVRHRCTVRRGINSSADDASDVRGTNRRSLRVVAMVSAALQTGANAPIASLWIDGQIMCYPHNNQWRLHRPQRRRTVAPIATSSPPSETTLGRPMSAAFCGSWGRWMTATSGAGH